MIHGTDAFMDSFCTGDLLIVWFVCAVVPAPMVGFEWFSHLLDLAQLKDQLSKVLRIPLFFPYTQPPFLFFSRADSSGHLKQTVLRRKLLAPPPKMVVPWCT